MKDAGSVRTALMTSGWGFAGRLENACVISMICWSLPRVVREAEDVLVENGHGSDFFAEVAADCVLCCWLARGVICGRREVLALA